MTTENNIIDFGQVDSGFNPIPEDRYIVKCVEAKLGESQTGNPKIEAQFEVVSNSEGDETYAGRRLWDNFSLLQKALFSLKDFLDAGGIDVAEAQMTPDEIPNAMEGLETSVYVKINKQYNSNNLENWKSVSDGEEAAIF